MYRGPSVDVPQAKLGTDLLVTECMTSTHSPSSTEGVSLKITSLATTLHGITWHLFPVDHDGGQSRQVHRNTVKSTIQFTKLSIDITR